MRSSDHCQHRCASPNALVTVQALHSITLRVQIGVRSSAPLPRRLRQIPTCITLRQMDRQAVAVLQFKD